jgi:hypothetical protein
MVVCILPTYPDYHYQTLARARDAIQTAFKETSKEA